MEKAKTGVFSNSLIWFGAAVSIAEILTGTCLAPLGFAKGLFAIVLGHLIGGVLLYLAGLIGAKTEKSSMETVKISFGQKGSLLFSSLNLLQLLGWTSIMIVSGASAASSALSLSGNWVWSLIIGALILVWILVGIKNLSWLNTIAMSALLLLSLILSFVVFRGATVGVQPSGELSFGAAVELSVAMPLSWLPLIADYTRTAKRKRAATLASAATYTAVSCWMYAIGMGAALFTGESDIAAIMLKAGLGIAGLLIIILSTVTTTYLDAYSAGVSSASISSKLNEKWVAVVVTIIGTALAILTPITSIEGFLYLIGSVFAPMIAIVITDFFILKLDCSAKLLSLKNLILWAAGFALYRVFLHLDTPLGSTLPVMILISILCILTNKILGGKKKCLENT